MTDYVVLVGSEDVQRAGHEMSQAAGSMNRAAAIIDESLNRHQQFLNEWLDRLAAVLRNPGSQP